MYKFCLPIDERTQVMPRYFFIFGSISGFLSVLFGAFGAHILEHRVDVAAMKWFQTAIQYQTFHSCALLATAWASTYFYRKLVLIAGSAFVLGIIFFCGSLLLMSLGGPRKLGAITPIGGLSFLVGWICLAIAAWRSK